MRLANRNTRIENELNAGTADVWYWRYLKQSTEPLVVALRKSVEHNPMLVLACERATPRKRHLCSYRTWEEVVETISSGKAIVLTTVQHAQYLSSRFCEHFHLHVRNKKLFQGNLNTWPINLGKGSGLGAFILHNNTANRYVKFVNVFHVF